LAKSFVDFAVKYGFDGVGHWIGNIRLVEASIQGNLRTRQITPCLMQAFRDAITAQRSADGKNYALSIAAPASPIILQNLELAKVGSIVDYINLMAYDFYGAWQNTTGFNAPLYAQSKDPNPDPILRQGYNADAAIQSYLKAGVPSASINLGVPFYGRGWAGVPNVNNGLYPKWNRPPSTGSWEAGVLGLERHSGQLLA
jgi:chitinase